MGAAQAENSADFQALLDEHWEWALSNSPEMASRLGDRRYNQEWNDQSLDAIEQRHKDTREFLRRTYAIDRNALPAEEQLNYELFRRQLQDQVDSHEFQGYLLPFSQRGGVQNLNNLTNQLRLVTVQDYDDWLARLGKIDKVIDQTIELAERGRKTGVVSPRILMDRIPDQIAVQLVEFAADSPFFKPFENLPESFAAAERERLRAAATEIIEDTVLPAYRELDRYFNKKYLPAARDSIGLSELPNGNAWYEYLARSFTTTRMTPDEIHRLGLEEVSRIRGEMEQIIQEVEFDGSFADFLVYLRTDPQFYFDNPDDLYDAYLATSKRIDPELVKLFGKLPRMPYGVKPIPESIAPDTTTAYYSRPGSRRQPRRHLLGKSLQARGATQVRNRSPQRPRSNARPSSADCPPAGTRRHAEFPPILGFTAFVEGWGLYSERLGYDLGLYQDPYSRFGQLTYDMWRAVRLVVDTGMHYKGWTRQQAIDFFKDNAAKAEYRHR